MASDREPEVLGEGDCCHQGDGERVTHDDNKTFNHVGFFLKNVTDPAEQNRRAKSENRKSKSTDVGILFLETWEDIAKENWHVSYDTAAGQGANEHASENVKASWARVKFFDVFDKSTEIEFLLFLFYGFLLLNLFLGLFVESSSFRIFHKQSSRCCSNKTKSSHHGVSCSPAVVGDEQNCHR